MGEVKSQGHIVHPQYPTNAPPFRFTSIGPTIISWDMSKRVFDLEKTNPKFSKKICQQKGFYQNSSKI